MGLNVLRYKQQCYSFCLYNYNSLWLSIWNLVVDTFITATPYIISSIYNRIYCKNVSKKRLVYDPKVWTKRHRKHKKQNKKQVFKSLYRTRLFRCLSSWGRLSGYRNDKICSKWIGLLLSSLPIWCAKIYFVNYQYNL